jgi:hypothetical protein
MQASSSQLLYGMNEHVKTLESGNGPLQMTLGTIESLHVLCDFQDSTFTL